MTRLHTGCALRGRSQDEDHIWYRARRSVDGCGRNRSGGGGCSGLAAAGEGQGVPRMRGCAAGVVSRDVKSASVSVDNRTVEMVRVARAKRAGFDADARVRVAGSVKATVRVTADACPGGKSRPATETRQVAWSGVRESSARDVHGRVKPGAKREAVRKATVKSKAHMREAGIAAATSAAKKAALATSAGSGDPTPTSSPTPTVVPTPLPTPPVSDPGAGGFPGRCSCGGDQVHQHGTREGRRRPAHQSVAGHGWRAAVGTADDCQRRCRSRHPCRGAEQPWGRELHAADHHH